MHDRIEFEDKQLVKAPFEHYLKLFSEANSDEISARTGLEFCKATSTFSVTLMGTHYTISFPDFIVKDDDGVILRNPYEQILLIRYLVDGTFVPAGEKNMAYEEMPWGNVYLSNFRGRVIGRILRTYGKDLSVFVNAIESVPNLNYEKIEKCDIGYRFEFINNLYISILLWEGDEEFSPSCQFLFSDNFKYAFTAEDIAVVGDTVNGRIKPAKKG